MSWDFALFLCIMYGFMEILLNKKGNLNNSCCKSILELWNRIQNSGFKIVEYLSVSVAICFASAIPNYIYITCCLLFSIPQQWVFIQQWIQ